LPSDSILTFNFLHGNSINVEFFEKNKFNPDLLIGLPVGPEIFDKFFGFLINDKKSSRILMKDMTSDEYYEFFINFEKYLATWQDLLKSLHELRFNRYKKDYLYKISNIGNYVVYSSINQPNYPNCIIVKDVIFLKLVNFLAKNNFLTEAALIKYSDRSQRLIMLMDFNELGFLFKKLQLDYFLRSKSISSGNFDEVKLEARLLKFKNDVGL
jgi:hypothetical protein